MSESKNKLIGNTLKATRNRRKNLACKTYELKFDMSHMSNSRHKEFDSLFTEAKWLYNHILNLNKSEDFDLFKFDPLIDTVNTLDFEKNVVVRQLTTIGSQVKQSVHSRMMDSIRGLSELKKKGLPVGPLKFKGQIGSILLKQFGNTYKFHDSKKNFVKIQNISGYSKVNGLKQIPKDAEFANATLIKRNNNFYLMVTVFVPKKVRVFEKKSVGLDFGIESTITTSDGEKFKINFPEERRTKILRGRLARKQGSKKGSKKSKSYLDNLNIINRRIEKINNRKKDARNKVVSYLVNKYETINVQDENIKGWKDGMFGKQVHNSALGGIMSDLKLKSHTLNLVDRYAPTTQLCPDCFTLNKFGLEVRTYECMCGYCHNRDIHSAGRVDDFGMGRIIFRDGKCFRPGEELSSFLGEHKELKSQVEELTSAIGFANDDVCETPSKLAPKKPEAHDL